MTVASTERPGDGPALVLMHGLGDSGKALARVVALLPGWHVVTMDLRGHGASATRPWSWQAAVDDVTSVIERHGLAAPYVGGHSLGGMVALRYALAGRTAKGVINLDGWGPGIPERYVDEDPAAVTAQLDAVATGHLPTRLARLVSGRSRQGREGTMQQVLADLHGADVIAWHRDCPVPSLAVHATHTPRIPLLGKELTRMQAAYHRGISRDLALLPQSVTVVEIAATHGLCRTHPQQVADAITRWAS